ncbi:hypothetical protein TYRP_016046 [Tyrophagus putrescentiae]|nr:hypothetical protein TYRP_016046 [Tyrophagus putrescentiae]
MTLPDGLQLGSTCRRLYALYRDSYKNRQSLVLSKSGYYDWERDYLFGSRKVPPITDHLKMQKYVPNISQLIDRLPNLLYLEIIGIGDWEQNIPYLVKTLNNSPMAAKLQSLKLGIYNGSSLKRVKKFAIEELRLPSLKHLSVCFTDEEGDLVEHVLNSPLFHSVLPQLTSFHIVDDGSHEDVYHFVREHVFTNDQLVAAVGTESLQVAFDTTQHYDVDEDNNINLLMLNKPDKQTLKCITYFKIKYQNYYHDDPVEFFHLEHCFPGLEQVSVNFDLDECEYCDYDKDKDINFAQKCGLKLARGLLSLGTGNGWQSKVKVKKVSVRFTHHLPIFTYNSLANLVADIKEY